MGATSMCQMSASMRAVGAPRNHEFYIHSSVHRSSKLIRSNKMQQYSGIYCKITLHVSGIHRAHHQEYIKL